MRVDELVTGAQHTCARLENSTVTCWGSGVLGQLGDGTSGIGNDAVRPRLVSIEGAVTIASSKNTVYSVMADEYVFAWGSNEDGELGNGTYAPADTIYPTGVPGLSNVKQIAAGRHHACGLHKDGTVSCFGSSTHGVIGNGLTTGAAKPTPVSGLSNITRVWAGGYNSCAQETTGTVYCWGQNVHGEMANNTWGPTDQLQPLALPLAEIKELAIGNGHLCAIVGPSRKVYCWGDNKAGQLGMPPNSGWAVPFEVPGQSNAVSIATGDLHTCAVFDDGTAKCWGQNALGQCGTGSATVMPLGAATPVASLTNALSLSVIGGNGDHTCVRDAAGAILCWGNNDAGQLGNGDEIAKPAPTLVVF
jgi:alpha-tubulin suppressor-like RCC1 family protein